MEVLKTHRMIYSVIPVYGIVSLSSDIVRIRHVQMERLAVCKPVGVHNWILNDRFPIGAIQAEHSNATTKLSLIPVNFQGKEILFYMFKWFS